VREQPDFSSTPRQRRPPVREVVALIVGLLALGMAARAALVARREADVAVERLEGVRTELRRMQSRLRAVEGRASAGGVLVARAAAAGETPPERIVAALAQALPDDARLERLSIDYGETLSLELQVVARDASAWDRTLERLMETGHLEEVIPGPERRDGEIRTSVSARWAEGPQ
jgi:hypothetical protein